MMKRFLLLLCGFFALFFSVEAQQTAYRDIYPDTWVGTDAVGRTMPLFEDAGEVKTDQRRIVGIFYVTKHGDKYHELKSPYTADVNLILQNDPNARLDTNHPDWTETEFHCTEPELGYFLSKDEYVIRQDISMLTDAGIDVLALDVTNAAMYWDEWEILFATMQKMKAEGNRVPLFCFWAFNASCITVVQRLYEEIYLKEKCKDLWFYWDGKPLLLYNSHPLETHRVDREYKHPNPNYDPAAKTDPQHPHYGNPEYTEEFYRDYTQGVKDFFTLRTQWWGDYEFLGRRFVGAEDNWCYGYSMQDPKVRDMRPEERLSTHNGVREQGTVTPAQHPHFLIGKSWSLERGQPELDEYDMPKSAYVPWLGQTVENPEGYGIYFQERWDEMLEAKPQFLFLNDWNEWTAIKFSDQRHPWINFMNRGAPPQYYFIDEYNAEFNRIIQPMKGGYTDNYYMQMAQNIRKYKGVRPIPQFKGYHQISVDGRFDDWNTITDDFRDTKGDVFHRNYNGYGGLHYTNTSGRNDIVTCKVAVDKKLICFWVEAAEPLTPHTDHHWMRLLLDADNNSNTGWYGYDYMVNNEVKNDKVTTLMEYNGKNWVKVADIPYRYNGTQMELAIPRKLLNLKGDAFTVDFKWSDNAYELVDPISFCINGDTAPNRRFNYRFIWKKY